MSSSSSVLDPVPFRQPRVRQFRSRRRCYCLVLDWWALPRPFAGRGRNQSSGRRICVCLGLDPKAREIERCVQKRWNIESCVQQVVSKERTQRRNTEQGGGKAEQ